MHAVTVHMKGIIIHYTFSAEKADCVNSVIVPRHTEKHVYGLPIAEEKQLCDSCDETKPHMQGGFVRDFLQEKLVP